MFPVRSLLKPLSKFFVLSAFLLAGLAHAQDTPADFSSSVTPPEAPSTSLAADPSDKLRHTSTRAFRSVAISAKVGVSGIGFDVATPLNSFLNLRGGAQFFSHTLNPNADGLHTLGQLTMQNGQVSLDIFPFRNSSFHISPGVTVHNDNHLALSLFVRPGDRFSLGDQDYLSDVNNPINGNAHLFLGNRVAPRVTIGWGNMLPRNGGHISVPFEIGFQYISSPSLDLHLYGNACDEMGNCGDINSSDGPQNIQTEIQQLNQDISGLRFYPLMSIGVSYRFGH